MRTSELLADAFERIRGRAADVVDGLGPERLNHRVDGRANSITWLLWHAARVQDDHVADATGGEQVWTSRGWAERFALPLDRGDTGYGHSSHQVGLVTVEDGALLTGYLDDVLDRTLAAVARLTDADLDRIVDEGWDPPVTLGVRLVSVVDDDLEHLGQAAFVRGLLDA